MGIVAEYKIQSPILHRALNGVPEMKLRNPAVHPVPDGSAKAFFWAWGDDFQMFEGNLRDHSMVADHERLTRVDGYRFYAVSNVEGAESNLSYPLVFENDILVLDAAGTQAGLEMKTLCPTKNALSRYRNGCRIVTYLSGCALCTTKTTTLPRDERDGTGFADRNAA